MVQSIETENVLLDGGAMYSCHAGFDKWNQHDSRLKASGEVDLRALPLRHASL